MFGYKKILWLIENYENNPNESFTKIDDFYELQVTWFVVGCLFSILLKIHACNYKMFIVMTYVLEMELKNILLWLVPWVLRRNFRVRTKELTNIRCRSKVKNHVR